MPRVREIEHDGGEPVLKEVFAKEREAFGTLFNTTKIFAHCPPILKAAKQLMAAVEASGLLDPQLRALVYLRVALINGCPVTPATAGSKMPWSTAWMHGQG